MESFNSKLKKICCQKPPLSMNAKSVKARLSVFGVYSLAKSPAINPKFSLNVFSIESTNARGQFDVQLTKGAELDDFANFLLANCAVRIFQNEASMQVLLATAKPQSTCVFMQTASILANCQNIA